MRVLHLKNIAGISFTLAKAQRAAGVDAHVLFQHGDLFESERPAWSTSWRGWILGEATSLLRLARKADLIHLHSYDGRVIAWLLSRIRKPKVVHYHGSELRLGMAVPQRGLFAHAFATTPDLMSIYQTRFAGTVFAGHVTFAPVPIDTERYRPSSPSPSAGVSPLLVHIASKRSMKGTDDIEAAFRILEKERGIRWKILEGMSHSAVIEKLRDAAVLVGQFPSAQGAPLGVHGMAEVEGMSLGLPVIAAIDPALYPADCPIVVSKSETLVADLGRLLDRGDEELRNLGERSRSYVEREHDSRRVAKIVDQEYRRLFDDGQPSGAKDPVPSAGRR